MIPRKNVIDPSRSHRSYEIRDRRLTHCYLSSFWQWPKTKRSHLLFQTNTWTLAFQITVAQIYTIHTALRTWYNPKIQDAFDAAITSMSACRHHTAAAAVCIQFETRKSISPHSVHELLSTSPAPPNRQHSKKDQHTKRNEHDSYSQTCTKEPCTHRTDCIMVS